MFELILAVVVSSGIGKMADLEDRSAIIWGFATFALCLLSGVIPLPYLRMLLVGVLMFAAMTILKMVQSRQ